MDNETEQDGLTEEERQRMEAATRQLDADLSDLYVRRGWMSRDQANAQREERPYTTEETLKEGKRLLGHCPPVYLSFLESLVEQGKITQEEADRELGFDALQPNPIAKELPGMVLYQKPGAPLRMN